MRINVFLRIVNDFLDVIDKVFGFLHLFILAEFIRHIVHHGCGLVHNHIHMVTDFLFKLRVRGLITVHPGTQVECKNHRKQPCKYFQHMIISFQRALFRR